MGPVLSSSASGLLPMASCCLKPLRVFTLFCSSRFLSGEDSACFRAAISRRSSARGKGKGVSAAEREYGLTFDGMSYQLKIEYDNQQIDHIDTQICCGKERRLKRQLAGFPSPLPRHSLRLILCPVYMNRRSSSSPSSRNNRSRTMECPSILKGFI